jgi:acyl-CoA reductase-like NAD-dependent aldehyde dehydrogenase
VFRGLEVVESVCNIGNNLMGETQENLSRGLDTYTYRQPLGVTAGICPFNFPAMIPLWMFPVSTACGNTMVMKPSEKDPGAAMILAKLAQEAGIPDGVVQVRRRCVALHALCVLGCRRPCLYGYNVACSIHQQRRLFCLQYLTI